MSKAIKNKGSGLRTNLFQEDNGNYSYARLACFICVLTGIAIAFVSILSNWEDGLGYCISFLGYGITSTSIQKIAEENIKDVNQIKGRNKAWFFQEDNGNFSISRLTAFLTLLSAIAITFLSLRTRFDQGHSYVVTFLTVSFGGKTLTKVAEENLDGSQSIFRQYLNSHINSLEQSAKESDQFKIEFNQNNPEFGNVDYHNYDNEK